jgi:hypothetical protein
VGIAGADREAYTRAWREVSLEDLLAELAGQAHHLGRVNARKTAVIRRMFLSLNSMTALAAACVAWKALQ